ncbi:hypothetical protein DFH06DRAFT_534650 [Mycena polygramma]|nr:hypothetical protein DFH06DRAFT_534650 [Mycena polygramma]
MFALTRLRTAVPARLSLCLCSSPSPSRSPSDAQLSRPSPQNLPHVLCEAQANIQATYYAPFRPRRCSDGHHCRGRDPLLKSQVGVGAEWRARYARCPYGEVSSSYFTWLNHCGPATQVLFRPAEASV